MTYPLPMPTRPQCDSVIIDRTICLVKGNPNQITLLNTYKHLHFIYVYKKKTSKPHRHNLSTNGYSVNPLVPNPSYTWKKITIFTMWVCYLKVGTKPKKFFKNSIFYGFYACIIYDTLGISGISISSIYSDSLSISSN